METEAKGIVQVTKVLENGVTYTITQLSDSDGYDFIVTTDDSKDKVEVNFHDDSLIIKEFDYEGKSLLGKEQYDISKDVIDISDHIGNVENTEDASAQAKINYGGKTTVTWDKHWYCYGSEPGKSYMKIGHTATYRIRTDTLSSKKEKKCDNFANAIKKSNSHYNKALAYAGGSGVLLGIAAGLVAANIAFPPSVIVTIVLSAVGGGGSVVCMTNSLIDSYDYYKDCKDLYAVIKGYGTKL